MNAGVTFHSSEQQLTTLLSGVHSGKIQLPDFQRDWVWDDERIRGLLASVSMSYPVGTLMLLDATNEDVRFASRPIQGVTGVDGKPGQLILDGQQRLTTLYQVLQSKKPVQTFDARKKPYRALVLLRHPQGHRPVGRSGGRDRCGRTRPHRS
ncbi:MAG: DUF262 domain-containing protein [Nocardioidaceae bacterium]